MIMNHTSGGQVYRTLVRGKLRQRSALSVGGRNELPGGPDHVCARDGSNRLTIPGTGLAGAFMETAGRVFPQLLTGPRAASKEEVQPYDQITGKRKELPESDESLWQSLVRFHASHVDHPVTEYRQGVGIRQATGATASDASALFDLETIPAGAEWPLFIEIDTLRGGPRVEAIALAAVWEWTQGRCWLGASAARGLGWMQLVEWQIVRLPLSEQAVNAWPNNRLRPESDQDWCKLLSIGMHGGERIEGEDSLQAAFRAGWGERLPEDSFHYLVIDATISPGLRPDRYGLDGVSVSGHATGLLEPTRENLLCPLGMDADIYRAAYNPDAPVVTSGNKPILPGSSLRGPLRHATSRYARGQKEKVADPNTAQGRKLGRRSDSNTAAPDAVARLFGLGEFSGRLLVKDSVAGGNGWTLAWLQQHAEDEFSSGVYGSDKFDRTAVLQAEFPVRLLIEAPDVDSLQQSLKTLSPALRLAELGYVPLGGGKWRGLGWIPWKFTSVQYARAGQKAQLLAVGPSILDAFKSLPAGQGGGQS